MPIQMNVQSRLDVAAAESAARQAKKLFGNAADDISRSFSATLSKMFDSLDGSAARRSLVEMQSDYAATARAAEDAERRMVRSSGNVELGIAKLRQANKDYAADSPQVIAASNKLVDAYAASELAASGHADAVDAATAASLRMGTATDEAGSKLGNMGRVFNGFGIGATATLVSLGALTTKAAGDFEANMTKLSAAADLPDDQFKAISDGILNMTGQVGYSADALSSGMFTIQKSMLQGANGAATAAEKLNVLKAAAQGAAIENVPVDEVVNALTTSLHDFNIPADQAANVMSKMRAASGEAKTTIDAFAGSLHAIEPLASSTGISMDDLWGTFAQVTQSGTSPEQAADQINNAMRSLTNVQGPAADAMQQLGINAQDVTDHLGDGPGGRGLAGTLQYLSDTAMQHFADANHVNVGELKENAQAQANATAMLAQMSPEAAKAAQGYADGSVKSRAYTMDIRAASAADKEKLTQFQHLTDSVDGFGKKFANGRAVLQSYSQTMNDLTRTQSGAAIAFQTTGKNTDETNQRIAGIGKSLSDSNGDVSGWGKTNATLNRQMLESKEAFHSAAIEMGESFVPAMKLVAGAMKDVSGFLEEHKGLADGLVVTLGTVAGAWGIIRTAMLAKDGWDLVKGGIGFIKDTALPAIERMGPNWDVVTSSAERSGAAMEAVGAKAETGAAGVEGAADAEAASQTEVSAAAATASTSLGADRAAAAEAGIAGVNAAADEEVAAEGRVTAAALEADGAIERGLAEGGAGAAGGAGVGIGAGALGAAGVVGLTVVGTDAVTGHSTPTIINNFLHGQNENGQPIPYIPSAPDLPPPGDPQHDQADHIAGEGGLAGILGQIPASQGGDGANPPGRAGGGMIPGYSMTDNRIGTIPGYGAIGLAGGEGIVKASAVRALGGQPFIDALNAHYDQGGITPGSGDGDDYSVMATAPIGAGQSPKRIADLEEQIRRKNQDIHDLEERQGELKNNAKQSERDHLQHEVDNARADLEKLNGELAQGGGASSSRGSGRSSGGRGGVRSDGSNLGSLGAPLPSNFGLDKGLPGMAEWGVDALMNIAAAPELARLSGISQASGGGKGPGGTTGLFGLAAANGMIPGFGPSGMGPAPLGGGLGPMSPTGIPGATPGGVTGYQGTSTPLDALATPHQQEGTGQGIGMSSGAMSGIAGAAGAAMPGAGIAAQIGMQEISRGIQFGGQLAGIGAEGLFQTFLPDLPMNGPLAKGLGGLAGGHPVTSNTADQGQQGQGGYQDKQKSTDAGNPSPGGAMTGHSADPLQAGPGGNTDNSQQSGDTVHGNQFNGDVTIQTPQQADPTGGLGMQQNMAGSLP